MKIRVENGDLVYDDPVTGVQRKLVKNNIYWVQPSANLPGNSGKYTVLDAEDGYGKRTRRIFVTAADVIAAPLHYNPGCIGQQRFLDEFIGVGDTQPLSGLFYKRSMFYYEDVQNPTKWTAITETEHVEP